MGFAPWSAPQVNPMTLAPLAPLDAGASVADAISIASRATGVDFRYLLETASRESSLNPNAKSGSSSAAGLYQFLDQTWLATLKRHGSEHGLGAEAGVIQQDDSGRMSVADPAQRQAILALRKDPQICALMAGELTRDSRTTLEGALGRPVDNGELYLAHFLGPREAARLIGESAARPDAAAATSFPDAARANRAVFYDDAGAPRTLAEVKGLLTRPHGAQSPRDEIFPAATRIAELRLPSFSEFDDEQASLGLSAIMPSPMMPALRLTPQILEILSSLDPLAGASKDENDPITSSLRAQRD
jgi:hypothetical protein